LVTESRQDADGKVIFVVQEAKVSRVEILGLKKTKEALVRSQIRTRPGDVFDQIAIRGDLNRLFDTGFFEDLSYRIADDTTTPGTVIVNITVKEKRTGQFGVGVGFDNRSKITGFVSLADTNFRGSGKRISGSIELGAQRTFEVGYGDSYAGANRNSSYDISVFNRQIFREPRSVSAIIDAPTTFEYREQRTGLRANYIKPRNQNRDTSLIFGFRAENARLFQVSNEDLNPVDLPQNSSGSVVAASLGYISDKRDLRLDPSRGSRRQITIEQALPVGSSSRFTKIDIDVRRYFPLIGPPKNVTKGEIPLPRLVLASRLAYGKSFGNLPPFEQYFVGGTDTVRGYESDEQFGDNQFYSNLELRFRVNRQFTPVLFVDAGKAYGGQFSSSETDELLYAVGVGIRVKTPIGAVRFDIANGRRGSKTHFGIGSTF
jgi:outer membrane protein insertion porin family